LLVRIAGWVLLLAGVLLCASIAWAALGFLLMGIGLLSLQIAERNRQREGLPTTSPLGIPDLQPETPPAIPEAKQLPEAPQLPGEPVMPSPDLQDPAPSDMAAWRQLFERDADLARVISVLAQYGQVHVNDFVKAYVSAAGDKTRLSAIVDDVIRTAKRNADRRSRAAARLQNPPTYRSEPRHAHGPDDVPKLSAATPAKQNERLQDALKPPPVAVPIPTAEIAAEIDINPPATPTGGRNTTITSADDDLTELIGQFAPDSSFMRKT
jgi:hypothetical protein